MKKGLIIDLKSLELYDVICAVSTDGKETLLVVLEIQNHEDATTSKLMLLAMDMLKEWSMTFPITSNHDNRFCSVRDSSYNYQFFTTGKNWKELSDVLMKHMGIKK